jgi:glycosyltransferase involved in cell wall biosynthesis
MGDPALSTDSRVRSLPVGANIRAPRRTGEHETASASRRPRTLVIVPAYDEEAALPGVLADLQRVVADLDVLVVDDGSTDATAVAARGVGVVVVSLPFNLGIGSALRAGFRWAIRHGYDRAVQFDADGQHDADEVEVLLQALDDGCDLVVGSRFASSTTHYEVSRVRAGGMAGLRFVMRRLAGRDFTDTSSGFRAFSRPMLEYFADDYPTDYLSDTVEALFVAVRGGFRVEEVPASMRPRQGGDPSTGRVRLLYHYLRVLLVLLVNAPRRRRRPS